MSDNKTYLTKTVPSLLKGLKPQAEPNFGIMTPLHMIEHLIWVAKSSVKDYGPPPPSLNEKQLGFMRFVDEGAEFVHRPSNKTKYDLKPTRMKTLEEAIDIVPEAIARLYEHKDDHVFYNPMMGILNFAQMELFQRKHFEYHLEKQYGLSHKTEEVE